MGYSSNNMNDDAICQFAASIVLNVHLSSRGNYSLVLALHLPTSVLLKRRTL